MRMTQGSIVVNTHSKIQRKKKSIKILKRTRCTPQVTVKSVISRCMTVLKEMVITGLNIHYKEPKDKIKHSYKEPKDKTKHYPIWAWLKRSRKCRTSQMYIS